MSGSKQRLQEENDYLLAQNRRLWALIKMPRHEAHRVLAGFPEIVASFQPPAEGEDYRLARAWHKTVARALEDAIQEAIRQQEAREGGR